MLAPDVLGSDDLTREPLSTDGVDMVPAGLLDRARAQRWKSLLANSCVGESISIRLTQTPGRNDLTLREKGSLVLRTLVHVSALLALLRRYTGVFQRSLYLSFSQN